MKKLISFLLVLLVSISVLFAKKIKPDEVKYQEIVELPGLDADFLFEKAKQSLVNQFKSAKDVIQYADKEQGKIMGRGWTKVTYALSPVNTWFTITIDVKNEKLRITFTDMRLPDIWTNKDDSTLMYESIQIEKFSVQAKKVVESIKNDILSSTEDEDW